MPGGWPVWPQPGRPPPGPKLSEEAGAFLRERLTEEPVPRSADLAAAVQEGFGIRVHPRSIERALARDARPKTGGTR